MISALLHTSIYCTLHVIFLKYTAFTVTCVHVMDGELRIEHTYKMAVYIVSQT